MGTGLDAQRFLDAQGPVLAQVTRELEAGEKRSHWMWFVFPQLSGLGHSPTARHYALPSLAAAGAYDAHPILGARLRECTVLVLRHRGRSASAIFGSPDDLKFRSCMTLFARVAAGGAAAGGAPYEQALNAFYDGPDPRTLALLAKD